MSHDGHRSVQYHDLTHDPVGLWQLDGNRLDSSGNNLHLSVTAGTERYSSMFPGRLGAYFDGASGFGRTVNDPILTILGSITIEAIVSAPSWAQNRNIVTFAQGASETEADNQLFDLRMQSASTAGIGTLYETGPGTNVTLGTAASISLGSPNHVVMTRDAGSGNIHRWYINGFLFSTSAVQSAPTGGTNSMLYIGQNVPSTNFWQGSIASVKIIPACLTADQVLAEYNRTVGAQYGRRTR